MFEQLPLFPPSTSAASVSPVRTCPAPASGLDSKGAAPASGSPAETSSPPSSQPSRSSRTSRRGSAATCAVCGPICTLSATVRPPTSSGRTTSEPPIGASASSLWPTATAQSYGSNRGGAAGRTGLESLMRGEASAWPTPTATDAKASGSAGYSTESGRHAGTTLTDAVVRWPTPNVSDANGARSPEQVAAIQERSGAGCSALREAALWPTPTLADRKGATKGANAQGGEPLSQAVKPWATPAHRDDRGKLNADWVEALMGFPPGWTSLPDGLPAEACPRKHGSRPAPSPAASPTAGPGSAPSATPSSRRKRGRSGGSS